jgi:hypothetical protein
MTNDLLVDPPGGTGPQSIPDNWHSDRLDLDAYLHRIGYTGTLEANGPTLAALHRAHIGAIAFENLDIILGRGIAVERAGRRSPTGNHRRSTSTGPADGTGEPGGSPVMSRIEQLAVVIASVRKDRVGPTVARWFLGQVQANVQVNTDAVSISPISTCPTISAIHAARAIARARAWRLAGEQAPDAGIDGAHRLVVDVDAFGVQAAGLQLARRALPRSDPLRPRDPTLLFWLILSRINLLGLQESRDCRD